MSKPKKPVDAAAAFIPVAQSIVAALPAMTPEQVMDLRRQLAQLYTAVSTFRTIAER